MRLFNTGCAIHKNTAELSTQACENRRCFYDALPYMQDAHIYGIDGYFEVSRVFS